MFSTDITKEKFDEISKTGYQVVILRDVGKCNCTQVKPKPKDGFDNIIIDDDDLFGVVDEIELADPNCKDCLGTGRKLFPILSNRIRVTNSGSNLSGDSSLEKQLFELLKDDALNFYFPYNYEFLTLKDYIAIVKMDSKNNVIFPIEYVKVFKITNIDIFVRNEFKFYKVFGSKKKVI